MSSDVSSATTTETTTDEATPSPRAAGRGRPRAFDEEAVLDVLTELFWGNGFEATSMSDIVATSGLNKSSLYNAFGSKQSLFNTVLERYIERRLGMLALLIDEAGDGIDALHQLLHFIRAEMDTPAGQQGCLAINTGSELGHDDPEIRADSQMFRSRMRASLHRLVERAATLGDLDPARLDDHTDTLLIFMLGLSVTVRSGADGDELDRLVAAAHATVDGWRV